MSVRVMDFEAPPFSGREALRYAGCREEWESGLLEECLAEIAPLLSYRVCWERFALRPEEDGLDLSFARTRSAALRKALSGCGSVIAFAATVGFAPDRLIRRYERVTPTRALLFQAIGAERIEALCDAFCAKIREDCPAEGTETTPRFSPGYGDLELSLQRPLLSALDAGKHCGITLTGSMLMLPSKSVTALIGLRPL